MTQPIQEVTTDRQVSALDYRTRQLARRPPLLSAIASDWAIANGDSDTIVANATVSSIPFDSVDIPTDSSHFAVGPSNIKPISIIKNGWYLLYLEAWWDEDRGDAGIGITQSGGGFFYNFSYSAGGLFARRISYHRQSGIQSGFQETFGPAYAIKTANVGGAVYHSLDTPASLDWNYGNLVIVSLGDGLDLPDDNTWTPSGESGDEQFRTYF